MNTAENKNLVIAMVLMLVVWMGFSYFFPPVQKVQPQPAEPKPQLSAPVADNQAAPVLQTQANPGGVVREEMLPAAVTFAPPRQITVETEKYQAVFSTQGARLLSFELKDYRATAAADSPPVQMLEAEQLQYASLTSIGTEDFVLREDTPFATDSDATVEVAVNEQRELRFEHVAANGILYTKTFVIHGGEYEIDTKLDVQNRSDSTLRGTVNLSLVQRWDDSLAADSYSFSGPATLVKDEIKEVDVDDLKEGSVTYASDIIWTSFQTKYFLSVVVPGAGVADKIEVLRKGDAIVNQVGSPYFTLQGGERRQFDYLVFIGPKEPLLLKAAGHQLERVVSFGFFNLLAQPLFTVLTFFYGFFKNYGIAIILLTVLIKIIFWPLTHKSYSSMKSMQKLQPEMQKLRDKFKDDKERLNKEMMSLYKTHSVNPLGGCLPMLVQIPVFFALYKVLLDSIALRHAPFAFWLTDLSAKDPYYITPLLMGASMFVQQKMTPTTADPMQAKIFMMMPIIFTFMFLNFPSGLVIYWLVNNLLTILQQYFIHRKSA